MFLISNGNSRANFASANFVNVASVDVVTRQTRRHSPSRVAQTRQTRRHSPSCVARTRQTRERQVWQVLRKFGEFGESGKFGQCRLDHFMHIKYVICA